MVVQDSQYNILRLIDMTQTPSGWGPLFDFLYGTYTFFLIKSFICSIARLHVKKSTLQILGMYFLSVFVLKNYASLFKQLQRHDKKAYLRITTNKKELCGTKFTWQRNSFCGMMKILTLAVLWYVAGQFLFKLVQLSCPWDLYSGTSAYLQL